MIGTGATPSAASRRRVTNSVAATTSTLTVGNGNASGSFNGLIEDGAGKVALVKVGTGTQTLVAPCTYTGETTVSGGTLSLTSTGLANTGGVSESVLSDNSVTQQIKAIVPAGRAVGVLPRLQIFILDRELVTRRRRPSARFTPIRQSRTRRDDNRMGTNE